MVVQNHQFFLSTQGQAFLKLHKNHFVYHFVMLDLKALHNRHLY